MGDEHVGGVEDGADYSLPGDSATGVSLALLAAQQRAVNSFNESLRDLEQSGGKLAEARAALTNGIVLLEHTVRTLLGMIEQHRSGGEDVVRPLTSRVGELLGTIGAVTVADPRARPQVLTAAIERLLGGN